MTQGVLHSTLIYRHDQLSDERLNVALLVIFPESGRLEFLRPGKSDLSKRLGGFFSNSQPDDIWQYAQSFRSKARKLSNKVGSYNGEYNHLVTEHFLVENGASLFFSEVDQSPVWKNEDETLKWLYKRFLSGYDRDQTGGEKYISNQQVAKKVRDLIKEGFSSKKDKEYHHYFREESKVIKDGVLHFTSSGYWKNGTVNLIHPLSLDVKTVDGVLAKSFVISKSAELLREKAEKESVNFHIVLEKPHLKILNSAYKESVEILRETEAPIKVITPEERSEYVSKVIEKAVLL